MDIKDLKVSQLARAIETITGQPTTAKSFNYKSKAVEWVTDLMAEHGLDLTDVLKAAGITMMVVDDAEPETPKRVKAKQRRKASKQAMVIDMLKRDGGATLGQIVEATNWLPHTARGFISGALKKKLGLTISSTRLDSGERLYRISD